MENDRRVILVPEDIFTDDIVELYKALEQSIKTLKKLENGIREKEFSDTLKKIYDVNYALKKLSEKDFQQVKASTIFLNDQI